MNIAKNLLILSSLLLLPSTVSAQQCPQLIWSDEFEGSTLDESKWSHQLGDGCPELCGWGNNELQYYQAENVTVRNGTLRVTAREQQVSGKSYTSGRIRTLGKGDWTFGRFEARIRMSRGQGIWPAFWMMPTDEVYGWPQSGEIDIMENVGHEPATIHGTIHFGDPWPENTFRGVSYSLHDGAFADDFHEFAVERDAGAIRWYVDDVLFSAWTEEDLASFHWPFDERFHILLNLAVGGNWPGSPDATTVFPQTLEVDYVRIYDRHLPSMSGSREVLVRETESYSISSLLRDSTYDWRVPSGARIVFGQGTDTIAVNWGTSGGDVVAEVRSRCGDETYRMNVAVQPADVSLEFPNQLQASVQTPSSALVTWNDRSDGEAFFEVRGRLGSAPWQTLAVAGTGDETVLLTRLAAEATYELRVRARNGNRVSPWSPKRRLTMPVWLERPSPLRATILSASQVRLVWTDHSTGEEAFDVERQTGGGRVSWEAAGSVGASTTSLILKDLVPEAFYTFRVRARGEGAFSEWSPRREVRLPAELARPDELGSTVLTPSQILLEWSDRSDGEELFEVDLRVGPGPWQDAAIVAADVERRVFRSLIPGTIYRFRIRARASGGLSAWSPLHRVDLPAELGRPQALRAMVLSSTSVRLEWRDRSDGEDVFEVGARIPPGAWEDAATVDAGGDRVVLTDLVPGSTYFFRVRARSSSGLSKWRQTKAVLPSGQADIFE